jgi:hypothetical protein
MLEAICRTAWTRQKVSFTVSQRSGDLRWPCPALSTGGDGVGGGGTVVWLGALDRGRRILRWRRSSVAVPGAAHGKGGGLEAALRWRLCDG